ncbi:MAG: DNA polymerase I [Alphaproteobacteria bacterium]|nr:DNA polymerase I [Alphaproteobacteria bacterium]
MTASVQPDPIAQPNPNKSKRLYLVDGSGYIFRAYHSLPPLTNPQGTPVGAVFGFVNMMFKVLTDFADDCYAAVIFDASRITFRNEIYPEYKAHRPDTPEDLIPQFALVREATRALNLPCIEMENYEADDLIASYAKAAQNLGMEVVIVSSDKDLMQLIGDGITMLDPMKQKTIAAEQVMEKFGVPPEKVVDAQALIGDSTDNVPGVPGIGPKTAAELIGTYGSLEGVLENVASIKQNKRRESLIEFAEQARISRRLVELACDVPLPQAIEELHLKAPEAEKLMPFLAAQNFKTLSSRAATKFGFAETDSPVTPQVANVVAPSATHYSLVNTANTLARWIDAARNAGTVAVDTETTGLDAMQAKLVGVSLCIEAGEACYIPVGHIKVGESLAEVNQKPANTSQTDLFADESIMPQAQEASLLPEQLPLQEVIAMLKPLLEDPAVLKIGQNIKYDMQILANYGVEIQPIEDTMLLSYVLDAGVHGHGMDELSELFLGIKPISYSSVTGTGRNKINFAEVTLDAARDYAAEDADITLRLYQFLKQRLVQERMATVYEILERPLAPVLMQMERAGVKVDRAALALQSKGFAERLISLAQEIYVLAGREFTIGSPKQLGEIMFDELGYEGGKKSSKSGAYATGADILEELAAQGHDLPAKVLEWRQISKLKSTYTDALALQIHPQTGRVHTSFSMAATTTGRLSSSDPNLQNIPIRTEEGRKIRHAFIAEKGHKLIAADYSQIELRLLAHMAKIPVLIEAFNQGADIHAATASQMFGVPLDAVDAELRRKAKTINFGIIYGISAHGLAVRLGIGRKEAAEYIEKYFTQYPGIKAYMDEAKQFAREHGYVTTLYGRKCHVKDINAKNPNMRAFSERAAINAPLQGTAADIIKRAMIAVQKRLKAEMPQVRMLLQVHDELLLEAPDSLAKQAADLVTQEMESAAQLSIPLIVDAAIGEDWGSIH